MIIVFAKLLLPHTMLWFSKCEYVYDRAGGKLSAVNCY